jgi:hypothetical protein
MWRHNVKRGRDILSQQISIVVCNDEGFDSITGFPATYNQLSYIEHYSYSSATYVQRYSRFPNEPDCVSKLQARCYGYKFDK